MAAPLLVLAASASVFALSTAGMVRGVEPFATWFYPLAWYPTLAAADALVRLRTGRWYLLGDARFLTTALLWSLPFWLFFELLNVRMTNWYYVFLPHDEVARWSGVLLSFATVLPAILVSRRVLDAVGLWGDLESPPLRVGARLPELLQVTGVLFFLVALVWPRAFFPLIWGGVTLLVDPWVYRRDPGRSLLGALERGRAGTPVQLLVGGLAIGFLWEAYNTQARGKWIYTVPGLEELRLFEMPLLGFLGFPVLALDGWAVWSALVTSRLAAEPGPKTAPHPRLDGRRTLAAAAAALVLCWVALIGMDRRTIASVTPSLAEVAPEGADVLGLAGHDAFSLARAEASDLAMATGVSADVARRWIRDAELATLRGIGLPAARRLVALGVTSVAELAERDPATLAEELRREGMANALPARIRVWVRAARSASP